jgi:hypothetical protein
MDATSDMTKWAAESGASRAAMCDDVRRLTEFPLRKWFQGNFMNFVFCLGLELELDKVLGKKAR